MSARTQTGFEWPIAKETYDRLVQICKETLPFEACGLLVRKEASSIIDCVINIRNVHPSPRSSFDFHPEEWTSAFFDMQKNRQQLVGFFHSHPTSAALPSIKDKEGWLPQSGLSYWIVSMTNKELPLVQPFIIEQDRFVPFPLVLA